VEDRQLEVVRSVVAAVNDAGEREDLSPFYASVPAFVRGLEEAGARGVVVFNRYYQPDIDLETLDVDRRLHLSTSAELPLRLHALAVLSPVTPLSLACTGGVHSGLDAAKAILCAGAHVVQLASVLLERGPKHVAVLSAELDALARREGLHCRAPRRAGCSISAPRPTPTLGAPQLRAGARRVVGAAAHRSRRLNHPVPVHGSRPRRQGLGPPRTGYPRSRQTVNPSSSTKVV
jgi:dihydroorotate dehydrogenase (fumarate)